MEVEQSLFRESVKGNPLSHLTVPGESYVHVPIIPVASLVLVVLPPHTVLLTSSHVMLT